jgi:hypothetical protein
MEHNFPSDTCVLACSGPSLNSVDVYSLGLPVAAVSTAIRKISRPNYWLLADYLNEMHGEEGKIAYEDPSIIKVVPDNKISANSNPQSLVLCKYDTSTRWPDLDKHLFSGNQPFVRGPHKSVTFGIQWLHFIGVKRIIWAGNDLSASSMRGKYCYEVKDFDMKKEYNYHKTLDQTTEALRKWYPIALQRGFEWYSWNCGPVFESFVPKFNLEWWNDEGQHKVDKKNLKFEVNEKVKIETITENRPKPPRHLPKQHRDPPIIPQKQETVIINQQKQHEDDLKTKIITKSEPAKEVVSNIRKDRRQKIDIRKNLRSL